MGIHKDTYVFKVVGDCEIKADVYRQMERRPAIVWLHGGALIGGYRGEITTEQLEVYTKAGFTVISIDYRLAPETKLGAIIEDIEDAIKWVRHEGPGLFDVYPERLAVIGHSAGGYLSLVAGFRVFPRPRALVSFYGYGDITGSWYSRPDSFYRQQPLVSEEEAYSVVGGQMISESQGPNQRGRYYLYLRQHGLWPKEVAGIDPDRDPDAFDPFSPIRNVDKDYPPTLLLHGDVDTDVPHEQSSLMAMELGKHEVEHDLLTMTGYGHGFDKIGLGNTKVALAFERVIEFLRRHV